MVLRATLVVLGFTAVSVELRNPVILAWLERRRFRGLSDALGVALWTVIGGLIGYVYFSLGLPGSDLLRSILGGWAALLMALLGGMVPLLYRLRERKRVSR